MIPNTEKKKSISPGVFILDMIKRQKAYANKEEHRNVNSNNGDH